MQKKDKQMVALLAKDKEISDLKSELYFMKLDMEYLVENTVNLSESNFKLASTLKSKSKIFSFKILFLMIQREQRYEDVSLLQ